MKPIIAVWVLACGLLATLGTSIHTPSALARRMPSESDYAGVETTAAGEVRLRPQNQESPACCNRIFTGTVALPEAVGFQPVQPMNSPRRDHSATLLSDGRVLVAGGTAFHEEGQLSSAEIYDPASGAWTEVAAMKQPRSAHAAALLRDGRVLVAGGYYAGIFDRREVEIYDPTVNEWASAPPMSVERSQFESLMLSDGRLLVVGGSLVFPGGTRLAELYHTSANQWVPSDTGVYRPGRPCLVQLLDGRVLVTGGGNRFGPPQTQLYDPASGRWAPGSGSEPNGHTASLLPDGKVLLTGGGSGTQRSAISLYDPVANAEAAGLPLRFGRTFHTATPLLSGQVLVLGGKGVTDQYVRSSELYDFGAEAWLPSGELVTPRTGHTATRLRNGRVLVAGGFYADFLADAELSYVQPANAYSATLGVPEGWLTSRMGLITLTGTTSQAPLAGAALSLDGETWGPWLTATNDLPVTTTFDYGGDGAGKAIYLRLQDANGKVAQVVTGVVDLDSEPPSSRIADLPARSPSRIVVSWSGSDGLSGVQSYDLEVRDGKDGQWTRLSTRTSKTTHVFEGRCRATYFFRLRATDVAGNVEPWPSYWPGGWDAVTTVDSQAGCLFVPWVGSRP